MKAVICVLKVKKIAQNREVQYFILLSASSYVYAVGIEKLNPTLENAHFRFSEMSDRAYD